MIDLADLSEIHHACIDLHDLQGMVRRLLGLPFRFFRISYGDELRLHLGELVAYSNPRMRGRSKGSFIVAARASSWVVYSAPRLTLAASDESQADPDPAGMLRRVESKMMEHGGFITPECLVTTATVDRSPGGFSLKLGFSDGSTFYLASAPERPENMSGDEAGPAKPVGTEIADWEVMTPYRRVLKVGPGESWDYLDSMSPLPD